MNDPYPPTPQGHSRQASDGYIINNESDVAKENEYKTG